MPSNEPADVVLRGGTVHTMVEGAEPVQAVALSGDRIVAVGNDTEIEAYVGKGTEVIDLGGNVVVPGLIENHGHFLSMGETLSQLDLTGAANWQEVVDLVAEAVATVPSGEWVLGFGWHQEKWASTPEDAHEGFPVHSDLSQSIPDHPVVLSHASGHAVLLNAQAMQKAGIEASTQAPAGGEVVLGANGQPTGLLLEAAEDLAWEAWEASTDRSTEKVAALTRAAAEQAASHGITTFVDAGTDLATLTAIGPLFAEGALPVRLWAMIRDSNEVLAIGELPPSSNWFRVGGIKVSLDGALGSRGAWLLEPYSDAPDETGFQLVTIDSLRDTAKIALKRDLQLAVHAIGDRANRELLDLYDEVFSEVDVESPRWRVEHAQHLHPDDIRRFDDLGVIASVQAIHCTSDGPWVLERLGEERARGGAYLWRTLIDSGALVVNGTDVPVEPIDPFANLAASISRRMADGQQFYPDQAMTPLEALASYTRDGAFAIRAEGDLGTIEIGKLADLVVLDRDPLGVDADSLRKTRVRRTILGGRTVYQAE